VLRGQAAGAPVRDLHGTQGGTYSPTVLRLDPTGIAERIREMIERL